MRSVAAGVALLVLASGCGHTATPLSGPVPGAHVRTVYRNEGVPTTVYAVGADIAPGVYTTAADGSKCHALAASVARFDPTSADETDEIVGWSARVGDVQRILLRRGEFFHVDCGSWTREDGTRPATPDPATRAGACTILVGKDRLVRAAMRVDHVRGAASTPENDFRIPILQDRLMAVVYSWTHGLWRPAGQLVDYLDDPAGYHEHGKLLGKVSRALARIHAVCGR